MGSASAATKIVRLAARAWDRSRHRVDDRVWLSAILAWALGLRLFSLDKGIWQDEYSSLRLISSDHFLSTLRAHNHPPVYFVLLKATSWLARDDSFLRLPSVVAGVTALAVLWRWLRDHSRLGALLALWVAATHPLWVRYSQEMRSYGLLLLLTTLSYWLADAFRERWYDRRLCAALTLVLSLAIATHLVAVFTAAAVTIYLTYFLAREVRAEGRWRRPPLTILPVFFLPHLTFCFFSKVFLTEVHAAWIERPGFAALRRFAAEAVGWPALSTILGPVPAVILGLSLLALVLAPRPRSADAPLLGAGLGHAALMLAVSTAIVPVFLTRTALPLLVPILAFVGLRLGRHRGRAGRMAALLAVALLGLVFSAWWLGHEGRRPFGAWKEVAESIGANLLPGDLLSICPLYSQGPLLHYLRWLPAESVLAFQADAPESRVAEIKARLEPRPGACRRVWQIVREDQNVRRAHGALDAIEGALVGWLGPPARSERHGLLRVELYVSPSCRAQASTARRDGG